MATYYKVLVPGGVHGGIPLMKGDFVLMHPSLARVHNTSTKDEKGKPVIRLREATEQELDVINQVIQVQGHDQLIQVQGHDQSVVIPCEVIESDPEESQFEPIVAEG